MLTDEGLFGRHWLCGQVDFEIVIDEFRFDKYYAIIVNVVREKS